MRVTPPQPGAGAPPSGPSPVAGGQPQAGGAEAAIKMVQTGFEQLAKMIQGAGQNVDPQDVKLFQAAVQATGNFIQAMTSEPSGPSAKPQASQPMPANAAPGAQPAPPQ